MNAAITTKDNPFSPFTQFKEWYAFDTAHNYHTSEYLAALSAHSYGLGENMNEMADETAIDEMLKLNLYGNYIKVHRSDYENK